jgi:hypothetical protein
MLLKNYSDFGGGKQNNLIQFLSYNLMIHPGKKFRALRENGFFNSRVVRKKNSKRNKTKIAPPPPLAS